MLENSGVDRTRQQIKQFHQDLDTMTAFCQKAAVIMCAYRLRKDLEQQPVPRRALQPIANAWQVWRMARGWIRQRWPIGRDRNETQPRWSLSTSPCQTRKENYDERNEDHERHGRAAELPAQPASPQPMSRALARQTNHMQQIAAVAKLAMDEVSDAVGYSALKAANTVSFAALIKQAAKAYGLSLAEEADYDLRSFVVAWAAHAGSVRRFHVP